MSLYTIADLHLSEDGDKPMDVFGHAWNDHKARLEKAWRETVREDDTVVVPGDVSWGMRFDNTAADLLFVHSLPGRKLLGKGNHDYWWNTLTKLRKFRDELGAFSLDFLYNNAFLVGNIIVCGTRGWFPDDTYGPDDEKIVQREAGRLRLSLEEGVKIAKAREEETEMIVFLHYPPFFNGLRCAPLTDLLAEYNIKRCFYGHLHGVSPALLEKSSGRTDLKLISADSLGFKPFLVRN